MLPSNKSSIGGISQVRTVYIVMSSQYRTIGYLCSPKVAVVVVKKRISARFFDKSLTNPSPGTIVDSEITKPEW